MIVCKYLFFIFSIFLFTSCQDSVNKTTWNKEDYLGKWGWKKTVKAGVAAGTTRMNIEFTEDGKYVMFWKSEPKDREARYAYTRTKEWKGTWDAGDFWYENTDLYVNSSGNKKPQGGRAPCSLGGRRDAGERAGGRRRRTVEA